MLLNKKNVTTHLNGKTAIIVSHPDDEVLWFSSILDKVDDVVIAYNDYPPLESLGSGRKQALKKHPSPSITHLDIDEPVSYNKAAWTSPKTSDYGIQLEDSSSEASYQKSFAEVIRLLSAYLNHARPKTVFTHNPWGEYGHEDHVQIYRAVKTLQATFGYDILVSCYAHSKTKVLMQQEINNLTTSIFIGQPNEPLYQQIKSTYQEYNVWTWNNAYKLPEKEFFFSVNTASSFSHSNKPHTPGLRKRIQNALKSLYVLELEWPKTNNNSSSQRSIGQRILRKVKRIFKK